jgi:hypothetical protein
LRDWSESPAFVITRNQWYLNNPTLHPVLWLAWWGLPGNRRLTPSSESVRPAVYLSVFCPQ